MDPLDAKVLEMIHKELRGPLSKKLDPIIDTRGLIKYIHQKWPEMDSIQDIRISIDNLLRLRCIETHIQNKDPAIPDAHVQWARPELISLKFGSDPLVITPLGLAFFDACMREPPTDLD